MGLIQATIETLASVLGCRQDQAEDVVHSPASARAAMSRRGFFKAAGAVAAGVVMLDAATAEAAVDPLAGYTYNIRAVHSHNYILKQLYAKDILLPLPPTQRVMGMIRRSDVDLYQFSRVIAEGEAPTDTLWRFQDDTRELLATVTDIDKARGIVTYDSAPVRRK